MQRLPQVRGLPPATAIAADGHDVAVMDEPVNEGRRDDLVAQDRTPEQS
jgi:hypothetical protein